MPPPLSQPCVVVLCVYTYTEMLCSTVPRRGIGRNTAGGVGLAKREGVAGRNFLRRPDMAREELQAAHADYKFHAESCNP